QMVMRFTDSSAAELHKAATGKGQDDKSFGSAAIEAHRFLRDHSAGSYASGGETYYYRKIDGNLELRLLEDVLSPEPGGFFWAAINGKSNSHLYFALDPHGVVSLKPEEVALMSWNGNQETITYPLSFHRASEYANGTASGTETNENF